MFCTDPLHFWFFNLSHSLSFSPHLAPSILLSTTAAKWKWKWDEKTAAATHWRTPPGSRPPQAQHLLLVLVRLLQMPLVSPPPPPLPLPPPHSQALRFQDCNCTVYYGIYTICYKSLNVKYDIHTRKYHIGIDETYIYRGRHHHKTERLKTEETRWLKHLQSVKI